MCSPDSEVTLLRTREKSIYLNFPCPGCQNRIDFFLIPHCWHVLRLIEKFSRSYERTGVLRVRVIWTFLQHPACIFPSSSSLFFLSDVKGRNIPDTYWNMKSRMTVRFFFWTDTSLEQPRLQGEVMGSRLALSPTLVSAPRGNSRISVLYRTGLKSNRKTKDYRKSVTLDLLGHLSSW